MTDAQILDAMRKLKRERDATLVATDEEHYAQVCDYADGINALLAQRQPYGWKRMFTQR